MPDVMGVLGVLVAGTGALWPWLGIAGWGLGAALALSRPARLPWPWPLVAGGPLGLLLYALALFPILAIVRPAVAVPLASTVGLVVLAAVVWRRRRPRPSEWRASLHWPSSLAATLAHLSSWAVFVALVAAAGATAIGAAAYAYIALIAARLPPILTGSSTGDWGLHVLRVAMLARQGIPPPSPLDPDYALQYRYVFHVLAAAFAIGTGGEGAPVAAAVSGLALGAIVLAAAALAYALTRSWGVALASGLLGALYGPSYWLPEVVGLVATGRVPDVAALKVLTDERWPLSPLAPSFPSLLTAQGSSPWLAIGVLTWLALLICLAAVAGADGGAPEGPGSGRPRAGGVSSLTGRAGAALAGAFLALLAFGADYYLPLAVLALATGASLTYLPRFGSRDGDRRRGRVPPAYGRGHVAFGAAGLALGLVALFLSARQAGAAGTAGGIRLLWNDGFGRTAVYGGNHAFLAGGESVPFPNWMAVHDWGMLFWPGVVLAFVAAWRRRDAVLLIATLGPLLTAVGWHVLTVAYDSPVPVDFRIQMYRYASTATAILGPLLPVGVFFTLLGKNPAGAALRLTHAAAQVVVVTIGGGAGVYFLAAVAALQPVLPPDAAGDVALARILARQPGLNRLAVLNGPDSFLEMYRTMRGGNLLLWWAWGGAAVPVGWDFGHPERYGPLYGRVVREYAPDAAAALGLTHVAVAPGLVSEADAPALTAFLTRCDAVLIGAWGTAAPGDPVARRLYRVDPQACGRT